tara:strand:- start:249 stop:758 length:510 start_codon:yes stop_codon:yes gene_type:complete
MTKKTDLSWAQLKAIWGDQFGITPTEVHQLLERHWLKENWTTYKGNMWKDPQNIELFKKYVQHVYDYMSLMEIHWRAALIELFNDNDSKTAALLLELGVSTVKDFQEDSKSPYSEWKDVTFAKYIGQWRNDFMMEGWLSKDDVKPMIKKVKSLTRSLKSKGLLVKKKKK